MRLFLCLFCLFGTGIFLVLVPPEWVNLSKFASGPVGLYYQSLSAFSIPLSLLILTLFRMPFIVHVSLIWSLWLSLMGFWILWNADNLLNATGRYGLIFMSFAFVVSTATVLVTAMQVSSKRRQRKET